MFRPKSEDEEINAGIVANTVGPAAAASDGGTAAAALTAAAAALSAAAAAFTSPPCHCSLQASCLNGAAVDAIEIILQSATTPEEKGRVIAALLSTLRQDPAPGPVEAPAPGPVEVHQQLSKNG